MPSARRQRGFTLIEIIVALMIFSIVVVVALAALVKIVDANKKAQTTQDAVIGLSFALESMSRELRTGSKIHCEVSSTGVVADPGGLTAQACSVVSTNKLITFQSAKMGTNSSNHALTCRLVYAYLFDTGPVLKKAEQSFCDDSFNNSSFSPIVPSTVSLTSYQLVVSYNSGIQLYPVVLVELTGYAGTSEKNKTYFNVQTASSPRTL